MGALTTGSLLAGCSGSQPAGGSDGESNDEGGEVGSSDETATSTPSLEKRAREEGEVMILGGSSGLKPFWKGIQQETGLTVSSQYGNAKEMHTRLLKEYKANKLQVDITMPGYGSPFTTYNLLQEGVFQTIPDNIIEGSPAIQRGSEGRLGYTYSNKDLALLYNKDQVSSPPTSLEELFSEKWKGKVVVDVRDAELVVAARDQFDDKERADQYIRNLADIATWLSSHFDAAKKVAKGAAPMSVTYSKYRYYDWGGPLAEAKIDNFVTTGSDVNWFFVTDPPHPNAGKFALNYVFNNITQHLKDELGDDVILSPKEADKSDIWRFGPLDVPELDMSPDEIDETWRELTGLKETE